MYLELTILQIISCILCLACVCIIFNQRDNKLSKYLLIVVICGFVQNMGYLLEMLAKTKTEAMNAVKVEYFGSAYITFFFLFFVCIYSDSEIPKWYSRLRIIFSFFVIVCVWLSDYVSLYYTSIEFEDTGIFPHLVLGHGILYVIHMMFVVSDIIGSLAFSIIALEKNRDSRQSYVRKMIVFTCSLEVVLFVFDVTCMNTMLQGYDILPVSIMIAIVLFGFSLMFSNFFDIVGMAREELVRKSMKDAVIIVDRDYKLEEANEMALELFPVLRSTKAGNNIPMEVMRILSRDGVRDFYISGSYYDIHVAPIFHGTKILGHTATLFDVTERKYQLDKMKELKHQADAANDAKSTFLANISHEIRTPINAIIGIDELLLRDYTDPKIIEYAESIQSASETLLELVSNILDISRIEAGKMKLIERNYNVREFFDDLVSLYSHSCQQRGLSMFCKIAPDIPDYLIGDTSRIKQVISNFVSNAIKYTKEGSVMIRGFYERVSESSGNLVISVEDTGIGIKEEDQSRLFDSFVRVDEERNAKIQGTGLGLSIARNLIELMDGEIKVQSEYGSGSVFTISIPQCIGTKTEADKIEKKSVDNNENISEDMQEIQEVRDIDFTAPDASILIVDDSSTNRMVAKSLLKYIEADISLASSGKECLEMITKRKYDLIFMDHKMPGMDGEETMKIIMEGGHQCVDVPVIMLTANAGSDYYNYYITKGFADLLSKPITAASINNMVRKHLKPELIHENTSKNVWKR